MNDLLSAMDTSNDFGIIVGKGKHSGDKRSVERVCDSGMVTEPTKWLSSLAHTILDHLNLDILYWNSISYLVILPLIHECNPNLQYKSAKTEIWCCCKYLQKPTGSCGYLQKLIALNWIQKNLCGQTRMANIWV